MTTTSSFALRLKKASSLALIASLVIAFSPARSAQAATSVSQLQQQQAALERQALAAEQAAESKKSAAQQASDKLSQVTTQLHSLQSSLQGTESSISSVNDKITEQNQELADLQSSLRATQDQEDALLRQLYITGVSQPDNLTIFSSQPISKQQEADAQMAALQKTSEELALKTQQAQAQVQQHLADLNQQQRSLEALKESQNSQKAGLADAQQTQAVLLSSNQAAAQALEAQASKATAQAAQIAQQIKVLQTTANWGSQIVSSYSSSWYYTQTGDYTRMGNTYETVNDIGCLITSIAMVATYYGHRISPDYIARNGSFNAQGSYYSGTPAGLGVSLRSGGGVNWGTVQNEVAAGRPVIVSIYLSSVGALNSDGSSHFIVIYGYENGKYLMQDPIGPSGRSYNLNQVRSMYLTVKS